MYYIFKYKNWQITYVTKLKNLLYFIFIQVVDILSFFIFNDLFYINIYIINFKKQ